MSGSHLDHKTREEILQNAKNVGAKIDQELAVWRKQKAEVDPRAEAIGKHVHQMAESGQREDFLGSQSVFLKTKDHYAGPANIYVDPAERAMLTDHIVTPEIQHQRDMQALKIATVIKENILTNPDYLKAEDMAVTTHQALTHVSYKKDPQSYDKLSQASMTYHDSRMGLATSIAKQHGIPDCDMQMVTETLEATEKFAHKHHAAKDLKPQQAHAYDVQNQPGHKPVKADIGRS